MSGYIKLARGWRDHPVLRGEYSRGDAWAWLIENACWKPTRTRIKGEAVVLQRGEMSFSQRFLADKWGWSKSRVDRFIAELRAESMIETRSKIGATAGHFAGQGQSILTVCNYAKYQDIGNGKRGNDSDETGATAGQQRGKEEEGKKVKKEDIEPNGSCASDDALKADHVFDHWNTKAASLGKKAVRDRSSERRKLVNARIAQHGLEGFLEVFGNFEKSDFLQNAKGIQFDWVIQKRNFQKILEGNYNG